MNNVFLIGRLTREPEVRRSGDNSIASFTLAVDRPYSKEKAADFIRIVAFGKTAETCERFLGKGSQVAVSGRIQTGSYQDKNGETRYTTDVIAERVKFLDSKREAAAPQETPEGFAMLDEDEDCPF